MARGCLSVGVATFLFCAGASVVLGPPPPSIHDEFSYLLAGDTFAHGRLANPTHPLWQHFESFHVLPRPTYASKYPPAPGVFLAVGQVLTGFPIVGVWLSLSLAGAAVFWMLRAWLPGGWSFLGAMLLMASPLVALRWGDSYWGGGVPLLGGALVLGAAGRLCERRRLRDGALLGLGLFLLAASRPYEGALAAIPAVAAVAIQWWRQRRKGDVPWRRPALAFAAVACGGAAFMGYYNARVTGSPVTFPYLAYRAEYPSVPLLGAGPSQAPTAYRHRAFEAFQKAWVEPMHHTTRVAGDRWRLKLALVQAEVYRPFLGYSLTLPFLWSLGPPRRRAVHMALGACLLVLAGNQLYLWLFAHYFAPAGAAVCLLFTLGLRRMMAFRRPLGTALTLAVLVFAVAESHAGYRTEWGESTSKRQNWAGTRVQWQRALELRPGPDLVMVRYDEGHSFHQEWVYNGADIDGAPVVWAREMDDESNRRLFDYFSERETWLLVSGATQATLDPYPAGTASEEAGPRDAGSRR